MIHGFSNGKIASVEEYLFDATLHGKVFNIKHCLDIAKTPIIFDGEEVDAFILDIVDDRFIVQLALLLKEKFDDDSNVYKTSYIRKLLNSDDFLSRFNSEFVERIKPTTVHTEDYTTEDKLWLLSHEELGQDVLFLKRNNSCHQFELFKHIDLQSYSDMLLNINNQNCYGWRLRSADSSGANNYYSVYVGCVSDDGDVYNSNTYNTNYGALCPACTIC